MISLGKFSYYIPEDELDIINRDIISRFSELYFFGYPLDMVNDRQVFRRLYSIASSHNGFCMESSAINMIALKGMTDARLVRGRSDDYGWHSWVEVEKNGVVIVVDNCWLYEDLDEPNFYFMESDQYYEVAGLIANNSVKQRRFAAQMIQEEILPHHPLEAIRRLMDDASLGFNFKQPPTLVPYD